jgi:hypothetical protein
MATIPELLDGHITLEVECLDRLYLNGYIGKLATGPGLSMFMRFQLGKPVPSPVVLGQVSERFRGAVKTQAELEANADRSERDGCWSACSAGTPDVAAPPHAFAVGTE